MSFMKESTKLGEVYFVVLSDYTEFGQFGYFFFASLYLSRGGGRGVRKNGPTRKGMSQPSKGMTSYVHCTMYISATMSINLT